MNELSPYFIRRTSPPAAENTTVLNRPVFLEEEEGLDLWSCWGVLKKRKWHIATVFFAVVLPVAFYTFTQPPIYTAETTLLIEQKAPQVINIQQVLSDSLSLGTDKHDYYKTQYELLKSRSLAAQVIREQELEENSLFTQVESKGLVAELWTRVKGWFKEPQWVRGILGRPSFSRTKEANSPSRIDSPFGVDPGLINDYIDDMLDVGPLGETRLVQIAFSSSDPKLSARLANAHAQAYIRQGLKLRSQATEEAQRFLEEKLAELKERVEKSEDALNQYRRIKGIISLDDKENLVVDRLADLNKRLTEAEAERIALEAQVRLVQKRSYDSLPVVLDNTLIRTLSDHLARLKGDYASLSIQFKSGYPRVAQLEAQVEETQRRLEREIQKVVKGIESAYLAAEAKEKKLMATVEKQKNAALSLKDASVEYAILAREVNTNRQLYDSVLQRMKEMGVAAEIRSSNVFVIDEAAPPHKPSGPKMRLHLILGAFVGLMGGVGLAFFFEYLDNTLKTPEEVERYLHLPNLSEVPNFSRFDLCAYVPQALFGTLSQTVRPPLYKRELVLSYHPFSLIAEMYRMLHAAILLSQAEEPPKVILFTSGMHGEGKTTTVVNTAITFAQMGAKVLVIDADLRHSSCYKMLEMKDGLGLVELLTKQRELTEVIKPTPLGNLFLISGGSIPPNPTALVGSRRMYEILTLLREDYDYIFVDSPPVGLTTDAVLLSAMADGVVLVVNGQETPKQIVREACSRLSYARAKILGVVLNRGTMQSVGYNPYFYYHHS
jgi:capsular exopolysaccharide synthesis family protein